MRLIALIECIIALVLMILIDYCAHIGFMPGVVQLPLSLALYAQIGWIKAEREEE